MNGFLKIDGICKTFGGVRALRDVSLRVEGGSIAGLVGENGAGKSTLMNILGGVVSPDSGRIELEGGLYTPSSPREATERGVAFIHQELNLFTNLTIAENIFIDQFPKNGMLPVIDRRRVRKETEAALRKVQLNISPNTRIERLSPGERQLVEIAKALRRDAKLIIFDEPTTSLTAKETERLFSIIRKLKSEGKTIIFISHILNDVIELADFIAVLRDGRVRGSGPVKDFPIPKMISLMVGRDIENLYPEMSHRTSGREILVLKQVSQPGIVREIDLSISEGEIVGMFGLMGSGRTELARIIFGVDPFAGGKISFNGNALGSGQVKERIDAGIAFVTEDRREEGLLMELPITQNLALVVLRSFLTPVGGLVKDRAIAVASNEMAAKLRIKCADIETTPAKSLSGGNQQKVVLGKWLLSKPGLLILDEPTRGVDVGAKYEVHSIVQDLAGKGTGVLMISSELEELMGTCDRIVVLSRGELTGCFGRENFDKEKILAAAFRQGVAS
jgi:ribose transport system ATP-binding protein